MRIGLSILTHDDHNVWNNGICQNVYHLACLLESVPFVDKVVLLNTGDQGGPPHNTGDIGKRFPLLTQREATDAIDVAIEISGGLDVEWIAAFRARGGKMVNLVCGQPYHGLIEPTIFNKGGFFSDAQRCDEIWLLPKDEPFAAMMRSIHRCPVHVVPYIWSPIFLELSAADAEAKNLHFGYQRGSLAHGPAIPAIFEPNISPIKMGIIPFMICEAVENANPSTISRVHFMNSVHMVKHNTFIFLIDRSNLYQKQKLSIEERNYFAVVMSESNIVISHQICCPQNYLYFDALYGNYPLIHNSKFFSDVGYYYQDSDIEAGRDQFMLACQEHDHNLSTYTARNQALIANVSPGNRANQSIYARRLLHVFATKTVGQAA